MKTDRREFFKLTGAAGAGMIALGGIPANGKPAVPPSSKEEVTGTAFMTELFLDNEMIEVAPSVSRRLHQPKKHLSNPVVRCERWCEGNIIQPYTTMYDQEDKLFKMWARTGSDRKSMHLEGHAAYMTYFTSTDGVHWEKPDLGVMEIAGRRDHNIVFTSDSVSATRAAGPLVKFAGNALEINYSTSAAGIPDPTKGDLPDLLVFRFWV